MSDPLPVKPLRLIRRGELLRLDNVPPDRTLLQVLREDLACTSVKEGCAEGDCGACTVVTAEAQGDRLEWRAVNSCIRLAHAVDGMAVWTAEDIACDPMIRPLSPPAPAAPAAPDALAPSASPPPRPATPPRLHPVQQALVDSHASQCGFCTPGFVMSLFALYQSQVLRGEAVTREQAQQALSGNLCRCTGYRPILDAAQQMSLLPPVAVDEAALVQRLRRIAGGGIGHLIDLPQRAGYALPRTLSDLLRLRAQHPKAQLVAGTTDAGLWVTKQHRRFAQVLDLTRVAELRRIERYEHHLAIGAAVTLADAFDALLAERPQLQAFTDRFAGLPVRNAGTLGGNIANGSPIGDSMPLLIALGAHVVLMRWQPARGGRPGQALHRELPLEQLYTGYRQSVLRPDEVLAWIKVPHSRPGVYLRAYKVSKRFEDDISAVCLAVRLEVRDGRVVLASIGAGGVAAMPMRARATEAALLDQPWTADTVDRAIAVLREEFQPISDMRASAGYRRAVLGHLLRRFWLETQGRADLRLERFVLPEGEPA